MVQDGPTQHFTRRTDSDHFGTYRKICENRLRRLERYKKAKSFCSMEDLCEEGGEADTSEPQLATVEVHDEAITSTASTSKSYELLKEKMISLMENDVQLLQKLITLGDTIQELRERQRSSSETSLSSDQEEEDEWMPMNAQAFSASTSAITRLYVPGEGEPEEAEEEEEEEEEDLILPNVQYFSRKNSVLRIPIPPRASNRMLGKKMPCKPSQFLRPKTQPNKSPLPEAQDGTLSSQSSRDSSAGVASSRNSDVSLDSGIASSSVENPL